jgi:hypothetical protein
MMRGPTIELDEKSLLHADLACVAGVPQFRLHHGQDCCKTMPTTQVDVGQPTPVSISFTPIVFGTVELFVSSPSARTLARFVADQSHAPPILSPPTVLPLRI